MNYLKKTLLLPAAALFVAATLPASATTIDDFNTGEGHFASVPTASGTTVGLAANSTADRVTTDGPREGAGLERLVLNYNTNGATVRCRFLSGGGTVANNLPFTVTAGVNAYIGYYLKTTNSNWETSLTTDGAGGTLAEMDGGLLKPVIADGQWHLYEWNLGGADWGAAVNIGGGHGGVLVDGTHTIDNIFLRYTGTLPDAPAVVNAVIYLDFVAFNPLGSVADLLGAPCLNTPSVLVMGPLGTNSNQVTVVGVTNTASAVKVYQNTGSGNVLIGTKSTGIVNGTNLVTVSGMSKGAKVVATQVVTGQESCAPETGIYAGSGANPPLRVALSIRETAGTGPIGGPNPDAASSLNIHFLGATELSGGAAVNAPVIYPSNTWQTVSFYRGPLQSIADVASAAGTFVDGVGYNASESVSVRVYASKFIPQNGTTIYSLSGTGSSDVSSNDVFQVKWTWDSVPGATGYRVVRAYALSADFDYIDVTTNSLLDANTGWTLTPTLTPNSCQTGPSVKWNSATGDALIVGSTNNIPNDWGILEAISLSLFDGDSGPFNLYIDTIQNGSTVFQSFDGTTNGATDVGFRAPSFSGSTSPGLLSVPDLGVVSDSVADSGANSFRVSFQWNGTNASRWVRLTTSGVGNPMVDLNQPISFRLLLLPVGAQLPTLPPGSISVSRSGNDVILNWQRSYFLQVATSPAGPYADITARVSGPYTISAPTSAKFYRLRN